MPLPLQILHLEDDPLDSELVDDLLRSSGLTVQVSRVEKLTALEEALKNPAVALVISDYTIPGVDAIQALKLTRKLRPDVPYVFLSGTIGEELAIETLKLGATDYVLKQHLDRLPRAVRRALEESQEHRQRQQAEQELREARDSLARANLELEQTVQARTAALEAANRELKEFVYTVSHDLRAPLRHILSFATILQEENAAELNDSGKQYVQIILDSGTRMEQLLEGLLSFSRLSHAPLQVLEVQLSQLVEEARREFDLVTQGRTIEWDVRELPAVQGDPRLLRSVISNLLSNAIKYTSMRDPARIEIFAKLEEREVICCIRDNGAGFEMGSAKKLFNVFQRLHSPADFPGTGIGLASVRRIIQRHGGRTWAEATPGKGASFFFSLPKVPLELTV